MGERVEAFLSVVAAHSAGTDTPKGQTVAGQMYHRVVDAASSKAAPVKYSLFGAGIGGE